MTMRAVNLDFLQRARRSSGGGGMLLAAGVVAAFVVLSSYGDLKSEIQQLESRAAKLERRARGLAPAAPQVDASLQQEIRRANEAIEQLALPWDGLFRSVEGAASGQVMLLGIDPDAKSRMVRISAEASDAEAMFDYVGRLGRQSEFSQVNLLQHQLEPRNSAWPIRFLVSASWKKR
jgi:hypothetical protein